MNEVTLSVDIAPALTALRGGTTLTDAGISPSALPRPSAGAVEAFQSAMGTLVSDNKLIQAALEAAIALPLVAPVQDKTVAVTPPVVAPEVKPIVTPEVKPIETPTVSRPEVQVTPEVVKQFAEVIAPLVAENREVQVALETAITRPLAAPKAEKTVVDEAEADVVLQAAPVVQAAVADVVRPEAVQPSVVGIAATESAPKPPPTPSEVLIVAAEAVADAIMVTPGLLSGEGRIHVQLKPDVLGGTEIQLTVAGRTIAVEFQPQTVEMGALIQRCLPQLEQHLAAKIHSFTIAATVSQSRRRKG